LSILCDISVVSQLDFIEGEGNLKQDNLPDVLPGKYNSWCQRQPLVYNDKERYKRATSFFARRELSSSEQAAFYLHELTGCEGLEFVAFSNAQLEGISKLPGSVVLVPCFLVSLQGHNISNPLVQLTLKMKEESRFIYDGWIPIAIWDEYHVRQAVQNIDKALSVFCMHGRASFDWEPKYPAPSEQRSVYYFEDEHLQDLESISRTLDGLKEDDRTAIYRSLAWLSQSMRLDEPAARFLFSILAIESLATYIEETASEESLLIALKATSITSAEREKCIKDTLAEWLDENPRKAIEKAYFDCVTPITRRLKSHLEKVFASDAESYNLLFKLKVDDKTLYELRHYVAHGNVNALSETHREQIQKRVWDAERVARRYIRTIFEEVLNTSLLTSTMQAALPMKIQNAVLSNEKMYKGPTHMAEIYN
jgi:hypothetical protein